MNRQNAGHHSASKVKKDALDQAELIGGCRHMIRESALNRSRSQNVLRSSIPRQPVFSSEQIHRNSQSGGYSAENLARIPKKDSSKPLSITQAKSV